ncbi:MAG: tetratricopeptide repeat protein [Verrucomicrobiota bacterium]|jgi:tetratricopeptide (TPR) repeat protein
MAVHSIPPASPAGKMPETEDSSPLKSESPAAGLNDRWLVPGVCVFLAAITFAVFGQTLGHEFINFDDNLYVYENPAVTRGLNLKGVEWAFTHIVLANWHPLTMMSHMLDCRLYGLKAGGHHLTSVLLHTASGILLFLALRQMTGFLWRSAFVAAVFAIHPLRVESVAWVAERKDVLSGFFMMLTLWAWVKYVQGAGNREPGGKTSNISASGETSPKPRLRRGERSEGGQQPTSNAQWCYWSAVFFFALGLMSKPMLVTLPVILLLLDFWPLKRISDFGFRTALHSLWAKDGSSELKNAPQLTGATTCRVETERRRLNHLLLEKLPLLGLAVASCGVTIFAQHEAIASSDKFSLPLRMGNALISYVVYLGQMFWPSGLTVLYPFAPGDVGVSKVVLSLVLLAGISTGVFVLRRRPYFLTGWLWYLIMLAPVIGILQVGWQARADRYTYLPQIGLYLLLTWAAADLCAGRRHRRVVLGGCATVILVALIFCARAQTAYWRNSESLWTHTLACTSDNFIGHYNYGFARLKKGKVDEAIAHFQTALQINPNYVEIRINLGNALLQKGKVDEAIVHFQTALQINPDYAEAHYNLGNALFQKGKVDEAIVHFQTALQINPDDAEACYNLGNALLQKDKVDEAIVHFQKALQIKPDYAEAHYNLGNALFQKGNVDEAIVHFQKTLQIKPDNAKAHNNLGSALLQKGNVNEAIAHLQKALQLNPDYAGACYNLGNALLQKGDVDEAIAYYQKTLRINPDFADAHYNLGNILLQKGNVNEAIAHLQKALQIKPDSPDVLNNLAWLLATSPDAHIRDGVQAVKYAERACELTHHGVTLLVGTLAAAYAEAGRYDDAIAAAEKACALASAAGDQGLLKRNQDLLALYLKHQPYHEAAGKFVPAAP